MNRISFLKLSVLFTFFLSFPLISLRASEKERQSYKIYVDENGLMRRSDTNEEVSYYGTNYTLPFAHAYRATGYLNKDRKAAIDRDVQHMARLGLNAFRLHLWDVELTDSLGNLLVNDHLDLLDYLLSKLEERGIDIVLTAQTNFGNGYPEKNVDTGAYSYDYDNISIHQNEKAQEAQENYLKQLAAHVNPYTGLSYADDNAIIAMEINNEPRHAGEPELVTAYINRMAGALREAGFHKPILYNVSHNPGLTDAYYKADIQGTTFQWYPDGLVAGHVRKGNFLPYVDSYPIPWRNTAPDFNKMTKVVYEFDPGDLLYSYMYPAIARTFRKEGFQWITQFAYDPTDLAPYNTEYQTHFLNLAYTPSKALSMMVASEAAQGLPIGSDYGIFPQDTVFGDFRVSYLRDLSEMNSPEKFIYSNSTETRPKDIATLNQIAGTGNSPIVKYEGTGAYFLDRLSDGVWRLEVMPDVVLKSDPFEKPSLKKRVGEILYTRHPIDISLPGLGESYFYKAINKNNDLAGKAERGEFMVFPGVYLLAKNDRAKDFVNPPSRIRNINLDEYEAPEASLKNPIVLHSPQKFSAGGEPLVIKADIFGEEFPDSVLIYTSDVSFWRDDNKFYPMTREKGFTYTGEIPTWNEGEINYNIVSFKDGKAVTWPQNIEGTPLDWDFGDYEYYSTDLLLPEDPILLMKAGKNDPNIDVSLIPGGEHAWANSRYMENGPMATDYLEVSAFPEEDAEIIVRRYVGDDLESAPFIGDKSMIGVKLLPEADSRIKVGVVGKNGITYSAETSVDENGIAYVDISELTQSPTHIIPTPFPYFMPREFSTDRQIPLDQEEIDFVEVIFPAKSGIRTIGKLERIWME